MYIHYGSRPKSINTGVLIVLRIALGPGVSFQEDLYTLLLFPITSNITRQQQCAEGWKMEDEQMRLGWEEGRRAGHGNMGLMVLRRQLI